MPQIMEQQKKILIIGQVPPPIHGSNIMTELFIQAIDLSKYNYVHINKQFSFNISEVEKLKPIKIFRIVKIIFKAVMTMKAFKPDALIYLVSTKKTGLVPDLLLLYLSRRFFHSHNILYIHGVGHKKNYTNRLYKKLYDTVLTNKCSVIILSTLQRYDISFLTKNIYVLPNCISPLTPSSPSAPLATKDKSFNILFLSNIYKNKGLLHLLVAVMQVLKMKNNIKLTVAGRFADPDFEETILSFIKTNKLTSNVEFVGPAYGSQKELLFHEADLFVLPSYNEAFPLVLLEAMSFGLPVISTSVGGIPEIITDGVNGYIVPPKESEQLANRIEELATDLQLRIRFGNNARKKFTEQYSFSAYRHNVNQILNSAVTTHSLSISDC